MFWETCVCKKVICQILITKCAPVKYQKSVLSCYSLFYYYYKELDISHFKAEQKKDIIQTLKKGFKGTLQLHRKRKGEDKKKEMNTFTHRV